MAVAADPSSRGLPAGSTSRSASTASGASSHTTAQESARSRRATGWAIRPPPQARTSGSGRSRTVCSVANSRSRKAASPSPSMIAPGDRPDPAVISSSRSTLLQPRRSASSGAIVLFPEPGRPTRAIRRIMLVGGGARRADGLQPRGGPRRAYRRRISPSRRRRAPTRASPRPPPRPRAPRRCRCARNGR